MKEYLPYIVTIVVVLFPWIIGSIDVIWWFFTNHASGIVSWSPPKVMFAAFYPFVLGTILAGVNS